MVDAMACRLFGAKQYLNQTILLRNALIISVLQLEIKKPNYVKSL